MDIVRLPDNSSRLYGGISQYWNDNPEYPEGLEMETRVAGVKLDTLQLRSGDLHYDSMGGYHLFINRGPHPIWPHMQIVTWVDSNGTLSLEALNPHEKLRGIVVNRGEDESQRGHRFRQWYLERRS